MEPFEIHRNLLSCSETTLQLMEQLSQKAEVIHGEKRRMFKLMKTHPLLTRTFAQTIQNKLKTNDLFKPYTKLQDCSVLYAEHHVQPQVWHMDSLEKFLVINVALSKKAKCTEFLHLPYVDKDQNVALAFDYPCHWEQAAEGKKYSTPLLQCGDAVVFWSNCIHRGPETHENRTMLYLTFKKPNQRGTTTDFTYPNWAWLDARFASNDSVLRRSPREVEFLQNNQDLVDELFPEMWFSEPVRESVHKQILERQENNKLFPEHVSLYDVKWSDNKYYLAKIHSQTKKQVTLKYYATKDFPHISYETLSLSDWSRMPKTHITKQNIEDLELGGYMSKPSGVQMLVFPFTHRIKIDNPDNWEIIYPRRIVSTSHDIGSIAHEFA